MRTCKAEGCNVILVTREKMLHEDWPREAIDEVFALPNEAPVELFLDPRLAYPRLRIAQRLLLKKLGFRMLMDVIPLDATLVKGSHGGRPGNPGDYPVLLSSKPALLPGPLVEATDVYHVVKRHLLG